MSKDLRAWGTQPCRNPHVTYSRSSTTELGVCLALANVMSTEAEEDEAREERQRTDSVDLGFSKGFYWRQPSLFKVLTDFPLLTFS